MELALIDIGRGTQDLLLYRPGETWENSIQLVLPAPTLLRAGEVDEASARGMDLLFTGVTMGGGPLTQALGRHVAAGGKAWATPEAAATFDDDPEAVRAMGVEIVGVDEVRALSSRRGVRTVRTADVDLDALAAALRAMGIDCRIGGAAVAVQDHGRAPRGTSDRRFRFSRLRDAAGKAAGLADLAYGAGDLPESLTRMQGVKRSLDGLGPLLFMDTGFAALLGALDDPRVAEARCRLLLNAGNGHTLAGIVEGTALLGFFEHHTGRLDGSSLGAWLEKFVEGGADDGEVYASGGHGAFYREGCAPPGWKGIDLFAVTGPRGRLAGEGTRAPYRAAPHGQMMFTGNYGLYRAFEARWGAYAG